MKKKKAEAAEKNAEGVNISTVRVRGLLGCMQRNQRSVWFRRVLQVLALVSKPEPEPEQSPSQSQSQSQSPSPSRRPEPEAPGVSFEMLLKKKDAKYKKGFVWFNDR